MNETTALAEFNAAVTGPAHVQAILTVLETYSDVFLKGEAYEALFDELSRGESVSRPLRRACMRNGRCLETSGPSAFSNW